MKRGEGGAASCHKTPGTHTHTPRRKSACTLRSQHGAVEAHARAKQGWGQGGGSGVGCVVAPAPRRVAPRPPPSSPAPGEHSPSLPPPLTHLAFSLFSIKENMRRSSCRRRVAHAWGLSTDTAGSASAEVEQTTSSCTRARTRVPRREKGRKNGPGFGARELAKHTHAHTARHRCARQLGERGIQKKEEEGRGH